MTEQSPSQTNNTTPERQKAVPSFLHIEAIEDLRFKQDLAHNNHLMGMSYDEFAAYTNEDSEEDRRRIYMEVIDQYLADNGLNCDDEKYEEVRAFLESASPGAIDDYHWANTQDEQGNRIESGREVIARLAEQNFNWDVVESSHSVGQDGEGNDSESQVSELTDAEREARDAEFAELAAAVEEARELWAAESAKRQGRFFSFNRPSKRQQALREDYFAKVQALGQRHLVEHADYSEEDKKLIATTILFDEQEKLRTVTTEKLQATKVSGFIKWMNRGKWYTRIGKGVALGVGAGLAGSFLAGAVGAGIVTGGAVAATRFARGFALKDHDKRAMKSYEDTIDVQASELDSSIPNESTLMKSMDDRIGVSRDFEKDTRREQAKRRKAAAYGVGSLAVGSVLGYGVHEIVERANDANLTATHWFHEKWDNFWNVDTGGRPDYPDTHSGDNHQGAGGDHQGNGNPHHHEGVKLHELSQNARLVEPGEGWYQTFHELGIPEDNWNDVLRDAGPKLHGQGWAYFDQAHGEWRIAQPGKLPESALRTIAAASKRDGFDLAA